MEPFRGLLGELLGEDPAVAKKRMEQAMNNAQDLSGLVRKKPHKETEVRSSDAAGNGTKRKAEDEPAADDNSKKAKVEETKDGES
jgi:hypothetical protein